MLSKNAPAMRERECHWNSRPERDLGSAFQKAVNVTVFLKTPNKITREASKCRVRGVNDSRGECTGNPKRKSDKDTKTMLHIAMSLRNLACTVDVLSSMQNAISAYFSLNKSSATCTVISICNRTLWSGCGVQVSEMDAKLNVETDQNTETLLFCCELQQLRYNIWSQL